MLIYHPYCFAFAYGLEFTISIVSLLIDLYSIWLFGNSKMQIFMLVMDSSLLITTLIVGFTLMKTTHWILLAIFSTVYVMCISMYCFLRFYSILSHLFRKLSYVAFFFNALAFLVFEMSCYGFIPNKIGVYVFIVSLPSSFGIANYLSYRIIRLIHDNPLNKYSGKQTRLVMLAYVCILLQNVLAVPSVVLALVGDFIESSAYLGASYCLISMMSLGYSISNFLMMLNKDLEDRATFISLEKIKSTSICLNSSDFSTSQAPSYSEFRNNSVPSSTRKNSLQTQ
eukprot:NODE_415_length_9032_cov_0.580992.p4 type:complete len:283 gc:universal NODE_415_length_9032_cov_0.580992:3747-2899(-)